MKTRGLRVASAVAAGALVLAACGGPAKLASAAGAWEGASSALPHTIDLSVLLYNKDLHAKAGLDAERPPRALREFADHARELDRLSGDINGTYFGGNCGGCVEFTLCPSVWAANGGVLDREGGEARGDSPEMADVFALYRELYEEGVATPASKGEAGPTRPGALRSGNIGIAPAPSVWLDVLEQKGLEPAPISGLTGGESTFVGGDALGIGATTAKVEHARDFLSWATSDEAQVEVVAENKGMPTRTDLADNKYSPADPRTALISGLVAKGRTPYARNFNVSFSDPQSPWLQTVRGALFGDAGRALAAGDTAITKSLQQG